MTICIAYKDRENNKVICATDSLFLYGSYNIGEITDEKMFTKNGLTYLSAGRTRDKHSLRYKFDGEKCFFMSRHDIDEVLQFLRTDYIDELKKFATENNMVDNDGELNNIFILVYNGNIYRIFNDFTVVLSDKDYACIGCGDKIANGVFYALENDKSKTIREKIEIAINACNEFSSGCDNRIQWMEV